MSKKSDQKPSVKIVATNRRAPFLYTILETLEAGMVLTGPEVKSIRLGQINLQDGFGRIQSGEFFLWNVHVKPYAMGSLHVTQEPRRTRKLLVNKSEINRWMGKTTLKGLTIVPLEVYFKDGRAKIKLGLAKGKKGPDKREDIKRKTIGREMRREYSGRMRVK